MIEILDEIKKPNPKRIFSILSFGFAMVTIILLIWLLIGISGSIEDNDSFNLLNFDPTLLLCLVCVLGIASTILSFKRKELSNKFKWIGAIINVIVFTFFIYILIFYKSASS